MIDYIATNLTFEQIYQLIDALYILCMAGMGLCAVGIVNKLAERETGKRNA
jgi:hypothetical protein